MKILMVHGWGLGPVFWHPMVEAMTGKFRSKGNFSIVNLGYFGDSEIASGHFDLAIGHSLGLMWLLSQDSISFDRLVSICGFTRFVRDESFPVGTPIRLLERMQKNVLASPRAQVQAFLERACGASELSVKLVDDLEKQGGIDQGRLDAGLSVLKTMDLRPQWTAQFERNENVLVIGANQDPIATMAMTRRCFAAPSDSIRWIDSSNHLLPWSHPHQCASLIQNMIEA